VQRRTGTDPLDAGAGADHHPGPLEHRHEDGSGLRLLLGEDALGRLDERHPTAQLRERLRQLDADRAATHDQQVLGLLGQVEQGAVVEVGDLAEPVDRRDRGGRARGQDEPGAVQQATLDVEGVGRRQACPAADEIDPLGLQLRGGLVGGDGVDDVVHVPHHLAEVDLADRAQAPLLTGARSGDPVSDVQQGLARHAAEVGAVPTWLGLVHDGDAATRLAGGPGGGEPRGARSQHEQVVAAHRRGSSSPTPSTTMSNLMRCSLVDRCCRAQVASYRRSSARTLTTVTDWSKSRWASSPAVGTAT
jgi:hypothetical protein